MSDTFSAFKAGADGEPPDGNHTVMLERTSVFESRVGAHWLRTCWRTTDLDYYWETLNALEGQRMQQTRALVEAVGVDIEQISSWDELGDELAQFEDKAYIVKVSRNGDFLNTAVVERAQGIQGTLGPSSSDIPADTRGLPEPAPPPREPVRAGAGGGLFDEAPPAPAGDSDTFAREATSASTDLFGDDDIPF